MIALNCPVCRVAFKEIVKDGVNRPYKSRHLAVYKTEARRVRCQEYVTEEFKRDAVSQVKDRGLGQ